MPIYNWWVFGVDVFFVISGYLITSILKNQFETQTFSLINFYERRARRILPALTAVVGVSTIVAWFWLLPNPLIEFSKSVISLGLMGSNVFFWLQSGYFDTSSEEKPLLHVVFEQSVQKTKELFENRKKRVILNKSVPEQSISVPDFLVRATLAKVPLELPESKKITIEKYLDRNRNFENVFSKLNVGSWADVVEPKDIFCKTSECEFKTKEGHGLYGDDNHLNYLGAKRLLEAVIPKL